MSVEPLRPSQPGTRVIPHSIEAEQSLLSACLLSDQAIVAATELDLRREDFHVPNHGDIFDACVELHERGLRADPTGVKEVLAASGALERVGGFEFLVGLQASATYSSTNAAAYAQIVKDHSHLRRLIGVAGDIAEIAYSHPTDVQDAIARAAALVEIVTVETGDKASMWSDVAAALAGPLDLEPPSLAIREDKVCAFLYPGRVHLLNGESEAGKSLLAARWTQQVMDGGGAVLELDWEDSLTGHLSRLRDMGCSDDLLNAQYHYSQRDQAWTASSRLELRRSLKLYRPALVIIDAMTPALATEGADDYRAVDIAKFYSDVIRNCRNSGAAVLIIDHINRDGNTDFGGGGSHYKKGGIDGVSFVLKKAQPMGRGLFGRSLLTVVKDRHGFLRGIALEGKVLGVLEVDGTTAGKLDIRVQAPTAKPVGTVTEDGNKRFPAIMEAMARVIEEAGEDGVTGNQLRAVVRGKGETKSSALTALIREGFAIWGRAHGKAVLLSVERFPEQANTYGVVLD